MIHGWLYHRCRLPSKIQCWSGGAFVHVLKINPQWNDSDIWTYAKQHEFTIVTKDKDFTVKQLIEGSPPKIVHIKFGNVKFNDFANRIETIWKEVEGLLQNHSVINIFLDKIEAIR